MRYIEKGQEPVFLRNYKDKHANGNYDDFDFAEFRPLLRHELYEEQNHMCAYCCRKIIDDNSSCSVEHIEPRHGKIESRRSLDYDNLVATCNEKSTCGTHKRNEYDKEKFISPLDRDCEKKLRYNIYSGDIKNTDENEYTLRLLNLNEYRLIQIRRTIGYEIEQYLKGMDKDTFKREFMREIVEKNGFQDYIEQYLEA